MMPSVSHYVVKRLVSYINFTILLPEFSAEENVALPAMLGGQTVATSTKMARHLLDQVGSAIDLIIGLENCLVVSVNVLRLRAR